MPVKIKEQNSQVIPIDPIVLEAISRDKSDHLTVPDACLTTDSEAYLYLDVSYAQEDIDWDLALNKSLIPVGTGTSLDLSVSHVFVRASIGLKQDKMLDKHMESINKAHYAVGIGLYHYLSPYHSCYKQAKFFANFWNNESYHASEWFVDVELTDNKPWPNMTQCVNDFMSGVFDAAIAAPIIYTSPNAWNTYFKQSDCNSFISARDLWMAEYNDAPVDTINCWKSGNKWTIWQFSPGTVWPGISGDDGKVDVSCYNPNILGVEKLDPASKLAANDVEVDPHDTANILSQDIAQSALLYSMLPMLIILYFVYCRMTKVRSSDSTTEEHHYSLSIANTARKAGSNVKTKEQVCTNGLLCL